MSISLRAVEDGCAGDDTAVKVERADLTALLADGVKAPTSEVADAATTARERMRTILSIFLSIYEQIMAWKGQRCR